MKALLKILLTFQILIFVLFNANSIENKEIRWNIQNNFNNDLYMLKNVELNFIDGMPAFYSISRTKHKMNSETDLYLSFDRDYNSFDETDNYKIIYKNYHISNNKALYKSSAYFIGADERIELTSSYNSFFQSGTTLGSFSLSFWVYPSTFSNNETILSIGTQFYDNKREVVEDQSINAQIVNGRVIWNFNNIFSMNNVTKQSLVLESYNRIVPEKWVHINLIFDSYSGIIREYIDGEEEGIVIATEDGSINSSILNMKFHSSNRCIIKIAPSFFGAIDEFYIQKNINKSYIAKYNSSDGEIISRVKDFGIGGIAIEKIIPKDSISNNSRVMYYYRESDKPFHKNDKLSENIKWNAIDSAEIKIENTRYFQWKVKLLAGDHNDFSPKFYGITLKYIPNEPPSSPKNVRVLYDNGSIKIKWSANSESDLRGYKIYYGTKSNYYFAKEANEGASPIDIGLINNYELTGLDKNMIYYIAITAYDDEEHRHESQFSEEVFIRPIKTYE